MASFVCSFVRSRSVRSHTHINHEVNAKNNEETNTARIVLTKDDRKKNEKEEEEEDVPCWIIHECILYVGSFK